jgi:chaperonin GroES
MKFRPLHDRVVVKRIDAEEKTTGGLFGKWSGTEVKIDGQDLLIMKESDIMGVLDEQVARKKAA